VALAAGGCGGLCSQTELELAAELRRQESLAGAGQAPLAGGEYHLGVTYSGALFDELAHLASRGFEYRQRRVSVGTSDVGRRTAIRMQARPLLRSLTLSDTATSSVTLQFEVDAIVAVRAPGRTSQTIVPGEVVVTGHLALEDDPETGASLVAVMDRLGGPVNAKSEASASPEEAVRLGLQALDPAIAEAVREFVGPSIEETLLRDVRRLVLVRFPPVQVGGEALAVHPTGLQLEPKRGLVFVGFSTTLRPGSGGEVALDEDVDESGMTYSLHPGLLTAAARESLLDDKLPSRYSDPGTADADGALHVTLDEVALLSDSFLLRFHGWEQRSGACGVDTWTVSGPIALRPGGFHLVPTQAEAASWVAESLSEVAVDEGTSATASAWLASPLTSGVVELSERLLGLDAVLLGTGERIPLEATKLEPGRWSIDVALRPSGGASGAPVTP
jgi:hypothetical protein